MASIELRNVRKAFGAVEVIKGVDLDVRKGEFMVFVGPSGCGKSTLLRLISGLEDITSGEMLFDGKVVNALAPSKRGIAMVFQSYALYPHMTVYENMAFGLTLEKGHDKEEIRRRVEKAAGGRAARRGCGQPGCAASRRYRAGRAGRDGRARRGRTPRRRPTPAVRVRAPAARNRLPPSSSAATSSGHGPRTACPARWRWG